MEVCVNGMEVCVNGMEVCVSGMEVCANEMTKPCTCKSNPVKPRGVCEWNGSV